MLKKIVFILLIIGHGTLFAQKIFRNIYHASGYRTLGGLYSTQGEDGNLILATSIIDSAGSVAPVIIKTDPADGRIIWTKTTIQSGGYMQLTSLTTNQKGDILISGIQRPHPMLPENMCFVMLFNKDGVLKWADQFNAFILAVNPKAIFLEDNSIVFSTALTGITLQATVCRLNYTNGTKTWVKHMKLETTAGPEATSVFKDIVPDHKGGFILCTSNTKDADYRTGIIRFNKDGDVMQAIQIKPVTGDRLSVSSILINEKDELYLSGRIGPGISIIKISNWNTVSWQSNPVHTGMNLRDYTLTQSDDGRLFLYGITEHGDEGYTSLTILEHDSLFLTRSATIHIPEHALDPFNANLLIMDSLIFMPGTVRAGGDQYPRAQLIKLRPDLTGCYPISTDVMPAAFPQIIVEPYDVTFNFHDFNFDVFHLLLLQGDLDADTSVACSMDYFPCKKIISLGPDLTVCGDSTILLRAPSYQGYRYIWSTSDTSLLTSIHAQGIYSIIAIPPAGFGCDTLYDSIQVTYLTTPDPVIHQLYDTIWPGEKVEFTITPAVYDSVRWFINDSLHLTTSGTFTAPFSRNGIYTIRAEAWNGPCKKETGSTVHVNGYALFIPNSFTPDNNGINDVFFPAGTGITSYRIVIYDRWGKIIFAETGSGWTGEDHSPGVYAYLISITDDKGRTTDYKGMVTLLR